MNKKKIIAIIGGVYAGVIGVMGLQLSAMNNPCEYGVPYPDDLYTIRIQAHNSKFEQYGGIQTSSAVIDLIHEIISNNAIEEKNGENHIVKYTGPTINEIKNSKNYSVSIVYGNNGYAYKVIVTEKN